MTPTESVLAAVERRLLACDAYEALWHLERMSDAERALLVELEIEHPVARRGVPSP